MSRQIRTIELLEDGRIQFKKGRKNVRTETPKNEVMKIEDGVVYFKLNRNRIGTVMVEDYLKLSLWAQRLVFDHVSLFSGVISYDNGFEHKSLPAAIMKTTHGQKVGYRDNNHLNCCRENLFVKNNSCTMPIA